MANSYPCLDNPRMRQMLRHAKVALVSVAPDRVVLKNTDDGPIDPLTRLMLHLEPTSASGAEHMPSLEEASAMGLVDPDN